VPDLFEWRPAHLFTSIKPKIMKKIYSFIIGQFAIALLLALLLSANVQATVYTIDLALTGQQEVPPNTSPATGILIGSYDDASNILSINLMFSGLTGPTTAAHFHKAAAGVNGPVQIGLAGFPAGVTAGSYSNTFVLTPEQESDLLCGLWYVNIHTNVYPGGEIRSQVKEGMTIGNITTLEVALTGQKEVPANGSPGTGVLIGTFDHTTSVLSINILFNGMTSGTTAAHFHGPAAAGVNAGVLIPLVGFPTGVTSGMYSNAYILTPTQTAHFLAGLMYLNIHTSTFPGGEIRGQLTEGSLTGNCAAPIPTLSEWALIILAISLMATGMRFIYRS
jgi:hypothetical protein